VFQEPSLTPIESLTANFEEFFTICKPHVHEWESFLGLELVGTMDGSPSMGEPELDGERTQ
jgi:hypothetical protein